MNTNKKDSKLVSVIVTTYKRPVEIVKRAIDSVLKQTYKNIEIIIVNDHPEDTILAKNIKEMIASYNNKNIKYLSYEKNFGACHARNVGIKASKGVFIELLDDDDEWLPEKTEKQLRGFSSPKVGMVYSPYYNYELNSNKRTIISLCKDSGNLFEKLLWSNCIGGCSLPMIRREVFDECGMFDESFPALQDFDMWIRIAQKFDINCVDEPLIIRYLQKDSITKNPAKKDQGFRLFMEKYQNLYQDNKKALNHLYASRTCTCFSQGRFKDGILAYKKGLQAKRFSWYNVIEPLKGIAKYVINKFI